LYDNIKTISTTTEGLEVAELVLINNLALAADEIEDFSWDTTEDLIDIYK
jgi:hypothetical protein